MRKALACIATVAGLTAVSAGPASAAPLESLTVRGVEQAQTFDDANQNGQFDQGDRMSISGSLTTLSGVPAGGFQAELAIVGPQTGSISGSFVLPQLGGLKVAGTAPFGDGPPVGLRVVGTYGKLRALDGAILTIADDEDGSSVFTFQQQGRRW